MQQIPLNQSLQIELEKLPSIPHALLQLFEVIHQPDVSFTKIAEIIQTDPALTARVMSVANSGAYYQWHQCKDFNRLIVALGLKMVKKIAINSSVQQFFSQFNIDDQGVLARFWKTSLNTAIIARALAHVTSYPNKDEVYVAGLLHNLGELVCLMHNAEDYLQRSSQLMANTAHNSLADLELQQTRMEQEFIGAGIPEIGAWIIHGFDRDSLLGDAVLFQRETAAQLVGSAHLIQIVNLAHKLSMLAQSEPETKDSIFSEAATLFDLNQPLLEEMLEKCASEVRETAKGMNITINDDDSIELDNEAIQIELAENVRTIALSSSLREIEACRIDSRSEKELIEQIMQNLKVLFDLSNCLFFAYEQESGQLNAQYGMNVEKHLLTQFSFPLDAELTLPVQALLKGVPSYSQDSSQSANSSVLDRQLLRLLEADELLCIPLLQSLEGEKYGVLVAGFSSANTQSIKREQALLNEFAKASSEVITRDRKMAEQLQFVMEEEKSLQSLQLRKLVHEANNPLGVVRNYLQILSHKLADSQDAQLQGQLEILMEEVERVGNIVLRIRETPTHYSQEREKSDNKQVNINDLVKDLLSIFQDSLFIRSSIVANTTLDPLIPVIESNANSIKQILTNLFKNAVEAMPDGGEITITTRDQVNYNGKPFVELSISDNGPGIPTDVLANLFNPVKTSKSGEHSGLGLSIIKNLVTDMGGAIRGSNRLSGSLSVGLDQNESSGAEFVILLPRKSLES